MYRLLIFAALGVAYTVWAKRRRQPSRGTEGSLAGRRFRMELRPIEGFVSRPRTEHGVSLPPPLSMPQLALLDTVPKLDDAVELELHIDDPENLGLEYVSIDIETGQVLSRERGHDRRAPAMARWRDDARFLHDADEVIAEGPLTLILDYPLARPVAATLSDPRVTRLILLSRIGEIYEHVYEEEARSTEIPVGKQGGTRNRNATDGTFAISMHDLSDLVIEGISIGTHGGERWVTLQMGS